MSLGFFDFDIFSDEEQGFVIADMMNPNERLSTHYYVRDLIPTNTGLDNDPPRSIAPKLQGLAKLLEELETKIGPFVIASAYRSPQVNDAVGGSSTSRHLAGDAVDISPTTMTAEKYWGAILLDDLLREKMGHIAWKSHQNNALHITLPFSRSSGEWIQNVPQVAKKIAGSVGYYSASNSEIQLAKNKYLGVESDPNIVIAGTSFNPWVWGGGAFAGSLALMLMIRKR